MVEYICEVEYLFKIQYSCDTAVAHKSKPRLAALAHSDLPNHYPQIVRLILFDNRDYTVQSV